MSFLPGRSGGPGGGSPWSWGGRDVRTSRSQCPLTRWLQDTAGPGQVSQRAGQAVPSSVLPRRGAAPGVHPQAPLSQQDFRKGLPRHGREGPSRLRPRARRNEARQRLQGPQRLGFVLVNPSWAESLPARLLESASVSKTPCFPPPWHQRRVEDEDGHLRPLPVSPSLTLRSRTVGSSRSSCWTSRTPARALADRQAQRCTRGL